MSRDRVTPMTTTTTRDHWNGWACTDCVMFLANGETPPDWDEARTAEWRSRIEKHMTGTAHVTLGRLIGEDGCDCTHYDTDDHREGCERDTFSWAQCDHCGSTLGGERHAITGWLD